jgi:IS1 family transposase/transposase-like protein
MIISVEIHHCPKCASTNIIKNGHDYKGAQKFHCKDCRAYGTLKAHQTYSDPQKELILRAYRERASMRGIKRIFGLARQTLARWLKAVAEALPDLVATLLPVQPDDVLELDELWSFVLKKSNKRWVWIALCRRTRQIVAFYIGARDEASCRQLWQRIPAAYKDCCTYSDFWEAYQKVFTTGKHHSVGKESGQTAHVERWNNTLRQRLARFVRKTLSFSKSDTFHELVLKWFIHYYNLQCIS